MPNKLWYGAEAKADWPQPLSRIAWATVTDAKTPVPAVAACASTTAVRNHAACAALKPAVETPLGAAGFDTVGVTGVAVPVAVPAPATGAPFVFKTCPT